MNLGDATSSTDALNQQSGDNRYYFKTTTLNDILAPTGDVSMSSQKIINLASAILPTDALPYG